MGVKRWMENRSIQIHATEHGDPLQAYYNGVCYVFDVLKLLAVIVCIPVM
jgi:hypothetical protein